MSTRSLTRRAPAARRPSNAPHTALRLLPVALAAAMAAAGPSAFAQPAPTTLPVINAGALAQQGASIGAQTGSVQAPVMNINQTGTRAVMDWQSFSIGSAARVNIAQPSAQSVLINRVAAGANAPASEIYGQLSSNGRVFLINSAGITFGANAQVNVGSLVASTLDLAPSMVAGDYALALNPQTNTLLFQGGNGGSLTAATSATIQANPDGGGSIVLLGGQVVSQGGTVNAVRGHIAVGAGSGAQVVLPASNSGFIDLVITNGAASTSSITMGNVSHTRAEGGSIVIGGGADSVARSEFISIDGEVNAGSTTGAGGRVRIDPSSNGSVALGMTGGVSAASTAAGQAGGSIEVLGRSISAVSPSNLIAAPTFSQGTLDASGMSAGGTVTVGGTSTYSLNVGDGVRVLADANGTGNGGTIRLQALGSRVATSPVARSDYGVAEVYGNLFARGGVNGGNGGTIETSAQALNLRMNDTQTQLVSAIATDARPRNASGVAGTWGIDPFNVTITAAPTTGISGSWNPTGPGANISAADITAALNAGTSVDINTGTAAVGSQAGSITVGPGASIQRTVAGAPVTLTLRAHADITFDGSTFFATNGANTNINLYSDLDGIGGGGVSLINNTQISTAGGNFNIGGGVDPTTGSARGIGQGQAVLLNSAIVNTFGSGTAGNITIRGQGGAGSGDNGITSTNFSSLRGNNVTLFGRAEQGAGVSLVNTNLSTDAGILDIRGVAERTTSLSTQAVGVNISNLNVQVGTGSMVVAGRADDGTVAKGFPAAVGVAYNRVDITTAAGTAGSIAFAGEAANSAGAGLAFNDPSGSGLDIRQVGTSSQIPSLANVSFGAISSDGLALAIATTVGNGARVLTDGTVNFRPVGVDTNGQLVEQTAVPITVGPSLAATTGFFVDPAALNLGTVITGGRGFSIGSSDHAGLITVANGALAGNQGNGYSLQNQGLNSQGIALGTGVSVRDLGLLTEGSVTQSGAITVARDLVAVGGTASNIDLVTPGNTVGGNVAFAGANRFNLLTSNAVTIGNNTPLAAYDAANGSFAPVALTGSTARTTATVRSGGVLTVAHGIGSVSSSQIDLVSPTAVNAGTQTINPGDGYARAWAPVVTGLVGRLNLYGCVYADCSLSGIEPPSAGIQALFPNRPTVNVTANAQSGSTGQPLAPLTYGTTGLINGDTAATALIGALNTQATALSPAGTYVIDQGSVTSPTGYIINYTPANVTLTGATPVQPIASGIEFVRTAFLAEYRSDVYGRNLSLPFICTAASVVRDSVARDILSDPLASEWGKVRNQPQLSGCLEVTSGGQCAAF